MGARRHRLRAATALSVILTASAQSADFVTKAPPPPILSRRPAVDGVNGKIEGFGGWADWRNNWTRRSNFSGGALMSVSAPLGESFGVQVDALAASHRGAFVGGGGGHLFWRDPGLGLVGAYGTVVRNNWLNDTRFRVGGEGALYYGRFTFSGIAGYEEGSFTTFANPVFLAPNAVGFNWLPNRGRFFDMVDISYYVTDNIKLSVGHRLIGGRNAAALGGEALVWNLGNAALAGFVEGRIGENDYKGVWGGFRLYFGQHEKSLIARHREDDPPNWLKDDMFGARNGQRTGGFAVPVVGAPPPPPQECSPCGPCYPPPS